MIIVVKKCWRGCTIGVNIGSSATQFTDAMGLSGVFDPGSAMKHLLLGADRIGNDALVRFYVLHCVVLPLIRAILIGVHIWRIRKSKGLARPYRMIYEGCDDSREKDLVDTLPSVFVWELTIFMFVLAGVVVMAFFFDAPIKEAANPLVPENPAKAPWYFLGIQELVSYSALTGGIVIPVMTVLTLSVIPYFDRENHNFGIWFADSTEVRITLSSACFAILCCILILGLSIRFNWPAIWFGDHTRLLSVFINPGTLLALMFTVWSGDWLKKTKSTRAGATAFFTCFFIGIVILSYFGWAHRGPNWDFYWWPSLWHH